MFVILVLLLSLFIIETLLVEFLKNIIEPRICISKLLTELLYLLFKFSMYLSSSSGFLFIKNYLKIEKNLDTSFRIFSFGFIFDIKRFIFSIETKISKLSLPSFTI